MGRSSPRAPSGGRSRPGIAPPSTSGTSPGARNCGISPRKTPGISGRCPSVPTERPSPRSGSSGRSDSGMWPPGVRRSPARATNRRSGPLASSPRSGRDRLHGRDRPDDPPVGPGLGPRARHLCQARTPGHGHGVLTRWQELARRRVSGSRDLERGRAAGDPPADFPRRRFLVAVISAMPAGRQIRDRGRPSLGRLLGRALDDPPGSSFSTAIRVEYVRGSLGKTLEGP